MRFCAIGARHGLVKSGGHGKMEIAFERTIQDDAAFVDQRELIARAQEGHGDALGELDAEPVGKGAFDAGLLDPGNGFERGAARVERNLQDAPAEIRREFLGDRQRG